MERDRVCYRSMSPGMQRDAEPAVRSIGWSRIVEKLSGCVGKCEQSGLRCGLRGAKERSNVVCVEGQTGDWQEEEGERSVATGVGCSILGLMEGK